MNQEILQALLKKRSKSYALVWAAIYAFADKDEMKGSVAGLCALLKISKSTLLRGLNEGQKIDERIEYSVTADALRISGLVKGKRTTKSSAVEKSVVYKPMMDVYSDFFLERTGLRPKISAADGKALKNIIAYLKQQVKDKSDETAVVDAWKYVFANWDVLNAYHKSRVKLVQIDSDLPNILYTMKQPKTHKGNESRLDKFRKAADRDSR